MAIIIPEFPESIRHAEKTLGERGLCAVAEAAKVVDLDRYAHAVLRYARAVDAVEKARAEWAEYGSPMLTTHINGATVSHPLVRLIRDLESDAAAAGRAIFIDPASAEKHAPGGQAGRAVAKDRRARHDSPPATTRRSASAPPVVELNPRIYGERPVFDTDGRPVPLATLAKDRTRSG